MPAAPSARLRGLAALVLAALIAAIFALVMSAPPAHASDVGISNYAFSPASIEVHPGDSVTWTNQDKAAHTVTGSSGPEHLDSPTLEQGDSWSFTFTEPGTYDYYCALHPDMKGKVVVTGDSGGAPPPDTTATSTTSTTTPSDDGGDGMDMPPPDDNGSGGDATPPPPASCPGLTEAVLDPFVVHFKAAHMERSPSEQVSDLTNVDQYTKTHTVLFENMLDPAFRLMLAAPDGLDPFVVHFNAAHMERSPSQQVSDASNVDQYTKTHTVLFENMLDPTFGVLTGSSGC